MSTGSPGLFFARPPTTPIEISCKRILCVAFPRGLWLGDTFASYRKTTDAKRAVSFLLYLLEAVLCSQNVACFEVVRDDSYAAVGMERVVFLRLWIFLESDERTDAFNAHAERLVTPQVHDDPPTGKRKRKHASFAEEQPEMTHANVDTRAELLRCLLQLRLSHVAEQMTVEFTHAGAFVDLDGATDADVDQADDSDASLVYRLSAESYFEHALTRDVLASNKVHADDCAMASYVDPDVGDSNEFVWAVTSERRMKNVRMLDARLGSTSNWLTVANRLLLFNLPHRVPSAYETAMWLTQQASVVGIDASDVHGMTLADMNDKIDTMMMPPVMVAPIATARSSVAVGACDWSAARNAEVYPENADWIRDTMAANKRVEAMVSDGTFQAADRRRHEINVLADLRLLTSEAVQGWPSSYSDVRASCSRDMQEFNSLVEQGEPFVKETIMRCMFPNVNTGMPAGMDPTSFWMFQFVEYMRCEFGLDRPQAHMTSVIFPWSFVLLAPLFGMPGSLQARGPPGSGKGEGKKRLQSCVNSRMWFTCDSMSAQATSMEGLPTQCFWDFDENQTYVPHQIHFYSFFFFGLLADTIPNSSIPPSPPPPPPLLLRFTRTRVYGLNCSQGKKDGETLTNQTVTSNGFSKRARANMELGTTVAKPMDARACWLGSYNVQLNGAERDREICVELPRSLGEFRTDITRGAVYIALCLRILTGLSSWVWLFYMGKLFDWEETVLQVFCGCNKVMNPDSKYAVHARTREGVRILSMAISVFEIVSMYFRRNPGPLREDASYEFLRFVRANAMLSPTAVWTAFILITTGEDPRREEKTLALFKAHLKRVSGGTYQKTEDNLYYVTKFVVTNEKDSADFIRAANDSGLGQAICTQTVSDLMVRKCPDSGHPFIKLEQEGQTARSRYCVLTTVISDISVLTAAEASILSLLADDVEGNNVFISEDESQYVFKEATRKRIVSPVGKDPMTKYGKQDILAACDMLEQMSIGFDISAGLVASISIVQTTRLPNSRRATPGGPLDPLYAEDGVYVGSLPRGNVVLVDRVAFDDWRASRDGPTAIETEKQGAQRKLCSFFFAAVGAPDGTKVFGGVGGKDDTCAVNTVTRDTEVTAISIDNPKYVQRARRFTSSVEDTMTHCGLFPSDTRTVKISSDMHLCRRINAFISAKYPNTAGLSYNYP